MSLYIYSFKSLVSGWIAAVCDSISSFFSCCKLTLQVHLNLNVCAVGVCDRPVFLLNLASASLQQAGFVV